MAKVTYLGGDEQPQKTSTLGYDFEVNIPTEVNDAVVLNKLKRNPFFTVDGDVPNDPGAAKRSKDAQIAAKAVEREGKEAAAIEAAQRDADAQVIAERAQEMGATRDADEQARAAELAEHQKRSAATEETLRKAAGTPAPAQPDEPTE